MNLCFLGLEEQAQACLQTTYSIAHAAPTPRPPSHRWSAQATELKNSEATEHQSKGFWLPSWAFNISNNGPQPRHMMLFAREKDRQKERGARDRQSRHRDTAPHSGAALHSPQSGEKALKVSAQVSSFIYFLPVVFSRPLPTAAVRHSSHYLLQNWTIMAWSWEKPAGD